MKPLDSERSAPSPDLLGLRYLIAAENPYERRLLAETLKSFRLKVFAESENPWSVNDIWQRPDMIIWSWSEPRFEELSRLMMAVPRPIVMLLVPAPTSALVQRAALMGVAGIMAKPYSARSLLEHIGNALAIKKRDTRVVIL